MADCKTDCTCNTCKENKKKIHSLEHTVIKMIHDNREEMNHQMKVIHDVSRFFQNLSREMHKLYEMKKEDYDFDTILENSKLSTIVD